MKPPANRFTVGMLRARGSDVAFVGGHSSF